MNINNKKVGFVLNAILLIALGFVFGSMRNIEKKKVDINVKSQPKIPEQDSLQSLFFSKLKDSMIEYKEGSEIIIKPISYKHKIAVVQYANSQESGGYLTIDFGNNKIYKTKFYSSIGGDFLPIIIAGENRLIVKSIDEGKGTVELSLTDNEGNVIKMLKNFSLEDAFDYFSYDGDNYTISIKGKRYSIAPNYDLIPIK